MKTRLLILTFFPLSLFCQGWFSIGSKWYYDYNNDNSIGYFTIESIKDTSLRGEDCKILKKTLYGFFGPGYYDTIDYGTDIVFEKNNIIYFNYNSSFKVLYDFNKLPGDTISIFRNIPLCDSIGLIVVDSVTNVNISTPALKCIYSHPTGNSQLGYNSRIVEFVGCQGYLFPNYTDKCSIVDYEIIGPLRCFISSSFEYHPITNKICDYVVDINSQIVPSIISPNPTFGIINIPDTYSDKAFLVLTDINGRIIYSSTIRLSFDISNQPSGLYILSIYDQNIANRYSIIKF